MLNHIPRHIKKKKMEKRNERKEKKKSIQTEHFVTTHSYLNFNCAPTIK